MAKLCALVAVNVLLYHVSFYTVNRMMQIQLNQYNWTIGFRLKRYFLSNSHDLYVMRISLFVLLCFQDFLLCHTCKVRCELFHKVSHQKYLMFIECSRKVAEKNSQDPMKLTTVILNELLADETWLAQVIRFFDR